MQLHSRRTRTLEAQTFNNIRVESSLQEPLDLSRVLRLELLDLLLKDIDELSTDELPLGLGVFNTLQALQELVTGIGHHEVDTELFTQSLLDLLALVQTHASIVDQHSMEAIANSLLHQLSSNSRVNTTANGTEDLTLRTNQAADLVDLLTDKLSHSPILPGAADANREVLEQLSTVRGVGDLGVELHTVHGLGVMDNGSELGVLRGTNDVESLGQLRQLVTVGHPHGHITSNTFEQGVDLGTESGGLQVSMAIFSLDTSDDVGLVQSVGDLLQSVADSQDGDTEFEESRVDVRGVLLVDGVRAARQDDTRWLPSQIGQLLGAGQHFRVDIDLTEPSGQKVSTMKDQ